MLSTEGIEILELGDSRGFQVDSQLVDGDKFFVGSFLSRRIHKQPQMNTDEHR